MDSKQPAWALCYACPKRHVVMLQLPTIPVEVGLLLPLLVQKAVVFECLQPNTQKSSLIFEYLQKPEKAAKTPKMQAGKEMSPALYSTTSPHGAVLERAASEKFCHMGQDPRFFADNSPFLS